MVHLKTRKQQIEANKKAKEVLRLKWNIDGKVVEIMQPQEPPGCFETTKHEGVFFDGHEVIKGAGAGATTGRPAGGFPGPAATTIDRADVNVVGDQNKGAYLGNRAGWVRDGHHYQIIHWIFQFLHPQQVRRTGKFILIVDGWEAETGIPVNTYFHKMYLRVFLGGFAMTVLSTIGIVAMVTSSNAIVNGLISRLFLVFIPIALWFLYSGLVGLIKFQLRLKLDELDAPWWDLDDVLAKEDSPADSAGSPGVDRVELLPVVVQPARQRDVAGLRRDGSDGISMGLPSPLRNGGGVGSASAAGPGRWVAEEDTEALIDLG